MNTKCNVQGATRCLQSFIAVQAKRFSPKAPRFLDKKGCSAARSLFYSRKSGREYRARAFRQEGIGMKQECNFGFILRRVKRRCLLAAA